MYSSFTCCALLILLLASAAKAEETQFKYLSGLGNDDTVRWEFKCDKGPNADKWSTIGVPSNWELQGFGIYNYGRVTPAGGWASSARHLQARVYDAFNMAREGGFRRLRRRYDCFSRHCQRSFTWPYSPGRLLRIQVRHYKSPQTGRSAKRDPSRRRRRVHERIRQSRRTQR